MTESLPGGCWGIRVMTATRLSQKLLSKTCNLSFPQRGTGVSKENTTNTFIACGTWLKTPFYTSSAGVELPLGTQRIPHPLSLLFKSGAYLCGQMCLHKLVSTLSNNPAAIAHPLVQGIHPQHRVAAGGQRAVSKCFDLLIHPFGHLTDLASGNAFNAKTLG